MENSASLFTQNGELYY